MTVTSLDPARIQRLAETEDYPPITSDQVTLLVGIMSATSDHNDDNNDPAWDVAWSVASHWLDENRSALAGDVMEIGRIAEEIYPLCQAGSDGHDEWVA